MIFSPPSQESESVWGMVCIVESSADAFCENVKKLAQTRKRTSEKKIGNFRCMTWDFGFLPERNPACGKTSRVFRGFVSL